MGQLDGADAADASLSEQGQQQFAQDPRSQVVVDVENNVTELDVDILVDEGMDTPTVQAEQFDVVARMLPGAPPQLQPVLWEALFANSAFREKEKVLEILRAGPSPEQISEQQMMKQVAVQKEAAEIRKTESETVENLANAEAKRAKAQGDLFEAGARVASA